jgi:tetratricopeptide (TPR) repeat protein
MKNIFFIAILIFTLGSSSCTSMLDEDVRNQIADNYLNTPNGLEEGVKAGYSFLRTWYGQQSAGWLTVFGTDEFTNGNADQTFNNYTANINSGNGVVSGPWNSFYQAINACNAVIDRAPNIKGMTDVLKNTRVAEARFLRAHYYFLMVQTYGPLHLALHETQGASTVASRSPIEEVYKVIIDDLNFAVANLPIVATDFGRATLPVAKHMLAKVYLTKAGTTAKQADDYANAAKFAKEAIAANSNIKLLDDFDLIYKVGNEVNAEILFSVQYSNNTLYNGSGNGAHMFYWCSYEGQAGMYRDLENGRPWAHYRPTNFMLNLFSPVDSRNEKSFRRVWLCNKPGVYSINGKSVTLALGDTAFYLSPNEVTTAQRNAVKYRIYGPSEYTKTLFPSLSKYRDPGRSSINAGDGVRDFVVYRLAETYLLAAEALIMSNKADEALPYVNAVRRRAARTGATQAITDANKKAMEVTAADLNIDFILDERARELSGEYMRWFDLKRTGKLLERVKKYNSDAAPNIQEYHLLRPIPQTQIDRTEGGATAFPQNPGY